MKETGQQQGGGSAQGAGNLPQVLRWAAQNPSLASFHACAMCVQVVCVCQWCVYMMCVSSVCVTGTYMMMCMLFVNV